MVENNLRENDIVLELDLKSKKQINIYENEIMHVFINMLKNAQDKFLEKDIDNRKIEIKTLDLENTIKIDIYDNGGEIKEENINVIFEPYFSTKKEKNGTGIGLYMSKIIIEKNHKGKLCVYNKDGGVCFSIILSSMI